MTHRPRLTRRRRRALASMSHAIDQTPILRDLLAAQIASDCGVTHRCATRTLDDAQRWIDSMSRHFDDDDQADERRLSPGRVVQ